MPADRTDKSKTRSKNTSRQRRQFKRQENAEAGRINRNKYQNHQPKPVTQARVIRVAFDAESMNIAATSFVGLPFTGERVVYTVEQLKKMNYELIEWDGR